MATKRKTTTKRKATKRKTTKRKVAKKVTKRKVTKKATKKKATKKKKAKKVSKGLALVGLLINFFFIPWLGTIVMGRPEWKKQLTIWGIGILIIIASFYALTALFVLIGLILFLIAWAWGIISGILAIIHAD